MTAVSGCISARTISLFAAAAPKMTPKASASRNPPVMRTIVLMAMRQNAASPTMPKSVFTTSRGDTKSRSCESNTAAACQATSQKQTAAVPIIFFSLEVETFIRQLSSDGGRVLLKERSQVSVCFRCHFVPCEQGNIAVWQCGLGNGLRDNVVGADEGGGAVRVRRNLVNRGLIVLHKLGKGVGVLFGESLAHTDNTGDDGAAVFGDFFPLLGQIEGRCAPDRFWP